MRVPLKGAAALLGDPGVAAPDWREQIVRILGWREGALAESEGRPPRTVADSPEQLRFTGTIEVDAAVSYVVELATVEAAANRSDVGPQHVLVALLLEGESIGAGTGAWLGMTPGRVRAAAGLINEARVVADGAPHARVQRGGGTGPIVLAGGGGRQLPQELSTSCARRPLGAVHAQFSSMRVGEAH
ncbi:MAG TPA: hypothetical protein VNA57_09140 [Acidimicrobiales bacterium]|nr:hypothetical protein [Acidimicrobiales bacterium]